MLHGLELAGSLHAIIGEGDKAVLKLNQLQLELLVLRQRLTDNLCANQRNDMSMTALCAVIDQW